MPCCCLRNMWWYTIYLWSCYLPHNSRMFWAYIPFYWSFRCISCTTTTPIEYIHKQPVTQLYIQLCSHFDISHYSSAMDWRHTLFPQYVLGVWVELFCISSFLHVDKPLGCQTLQHLYNQMKQWPARSKVLQATALVKLNSLFISNIYFVYLRWYTSFPLSPHTVFIYLDLHHINISLYRQKLVYPPRSAQWIFSQSCIHYIIVLVI